LSRLLIGALIGATAVLATCGVLAVRGQFGPPEQLAEVEGPHGEWYALYGEYPAGDYDPSWHVYRFPNREAFSSARVQRGFDKGALFETYEEAGDHDEDATLEVLDGRFLIFSKAGLFHSLYDIECNRLLINEESPFHAASQASGGITHIGNPEWPRFYLQWKLEHLHRPIESAIAAKARCAG
jgi:hypothetical protein